MNLESIDPFGIGEGFTPAESYTQSDGDQEAVKRLMELFDRCYEKRLPVEHSWELNRLYAKGEQYLLRDRDTGEVVRLAPKDQKRLYSMNNQIRPTMRSLVGKLARMMPTFTAVPATTDALEVHGSRVADAFFAFFRRKESLDIIYLDGQDSIAGFGTACYKIFWDTDAGKELSHCEECDWTGDAEMEDQPCPQCQQNLEQAAQADQEAQSLEGQAVTAEREVQALNMGFDAQVAAALSQQTQVETPVETPTQQPEAPKLTLVTEGDLRARSCDIRDIYTEPNVVNPKNFRYVFHRERLPVTEVRRRFPEMAMFIAPEPFMGHGNAARLSFAADAQSSIDDGDDTTWLYEYHEVPTLEHTKGRVVYFANGMLLKEEPGLYNKLKRLPFYFQWWTRNPGEFWGESFIAQAWHRQKELNALETIQREHLEMNVRQKLLDPIGSRISVDEISATTAQRIKYNAAVGKPEFLVPPPLSTDVYQRRPALMEDIRYQAGITGVEAGQTASDPNGRAMAILQAESDQQIGPIVRRNIDEWKALHLGLLILAKAYYSPERQFSITGDEGSELYAFDEMKVAQETDLQLEVEDGLSYNQAVRLQQALDLMNAGALGNPQADPNVLRRFSKLAKVKVPGVGNDITGSEYAAALEVPRKLERGEPAEPQPFDDPAIFAEVLTGWLRSNRNKQQAMPQLFMQVMALWQHYAAWAAAGQPPMQPGQEEQGGGASQAGSDMSAPGGSANNAGHMPTDAKTSLGQEAQTTVQGADQTGENLARTQQEHEG